MNLVTTIAAALGLALLCGFLATKLRLPPLVGYLIAGIVLGPNTPGYIVDVGLTQQLAEIGVMLLMFGVGLHFSLEDLLQVRKIAVPGAFIQMAFSALTGWTLAHLWGWSAPAGLVFGLSLSVASTVVLIRTLESRGILETVNGRIVVGWLVVEDLAMVVVLVLLPPAVGYLGGSGDFSVAGVVPTIALAVAFISLMLILGKRLLPWILWQASKTGSREIFTLCVVAIALGIAFGASKVFGVSFALGAFFAGMVLRGSDLSHRAAEESLPLRDAFSVLFFVSVGMLFDPRVVLDHPWQLLAIFALIMLFNASVTAGLILLFRYPLTTALTAAAGTAQIGEFSFVLMGVGISLGIVGPYEQSLVLGAAIFTIAFNPLVFASTGPLVRLIRKRSRLARLLERPADPLAMLPNSTDRKYLSGQVVLVGYRGVGERIHAQLKEKNIRCVVVDPNRELVEDLRRNGNPAVSGDPADPMVLVQAHIARAGMLLVASSDPVDLRQMIQIARTLNPGIEIALRSENREEARFLASEKAGRIFEAEQELSSSMVSHVLERYGSHPD
ncbi:MAG TPA: cation:proton antiporter [Fibrobacteria bacterium]|nr:cation:proton antiporter [Fibrobacteria bacterium]HOX52117.1 cation:proton antiporter [Fibrobacteria bacterium]